MNENPTASPLDISKKSRRLVKRLIDFMYGVTITNKPQFTSSRKERAERIIEEDPTSKHTVEILMDVSRHGLSEFESFKNAIDGFRPKAEAGLKKMKDVKVGIEQQNQKE